MSIATLDRLYPGKLALLLIGARGKRPLEKDWNDKAIARYTNGADRDAHLERIARHVAAGGSVGWVVPPGVLALDCDAPRILRAIENVLFPTAPMQRSPRGGHLVVGVPIDADLPNSTGVELAPGVHMDLRSAGKGQIIVAPTADRAWIRPLPADLALLPRLPDELLERFARPKPSKSNGKTPPGVIPEGQRNAELASLAGTMRARGLNAEEIAPALLAVNAGRCDPPLDAAEVQRVAESIGSYPPGGRKKPTIADRLVALAGEAELVHTPAGGAYATVPVGGHRETHSVKGPGLRRWLARRYWEAERSAPPADAVRQALAVLEAQAMFDGAEAEVHLRVAPDDVDDADGRKQPPDGAVWIDLGDAAWRAVRIDASGWAIVEKPPIRFTRARGMLALPAPVGGADLTELVELLPGAQDADTRALLFGWLVAALRPTGPYPVLILHGEQGTGKSTTSRMLRRLVDPAQAELRAPPRDVRDLAIATNNGWVVGYDNLSGVPDWFSDALCRVATGGGFATRELYSDTDETIIDATRPVLVNGIDSAASRGDLLDRALLVTLPPLAKYIPESGIWTRFDAARPRLLGALLDAVALAIRDEAAVMVPGNLRLADATRWVAAAEPALPSAPGAFIRAYTRVRAEGRERALEASRVGAGVLELLRGCGGSWEGTAGELLHRLEALDPEGARRRDWPGSPRALAAELRRLAPALRAIGVEVEHAREADRGRRRIVRLRGPQVGALDRPDRPDRPEAPPGVDDVDDVDDRKHLPAARARSSAPRITRPAPRPPRSRKFPKEMKR